MKKMASHFKLLMAARTAKPSYVRFSDEEYGLYFSPNFFNDIGTPLAARGTLEELHKLMEELA